MTERRSAPGFRRVAARVAGALAAALMLAAVPSAAQARSDETRLKSAFAAIEDGDFNSAYALADQMQAKATGKLVLWRAYTDEDTTAGFGAIAAFMDANPGWPRQATLQARAEAAMPADMEGEFVLAFFAARPPVSPLGLIRHGEALIASGQRDRGIKLVQQGWIEGDFDLNREQQILARHGDILTPAIHALRVDRLLWDNQRSAATRLLPKLTAHQQRLAQARLTLTGNGREAASVISSVPPALRNDPGLLFDQARWHRRQGRDREAWPLILSVPPEAVAIGRPDAWWDERHRQARNAIEQGLYDKAYGMVQHHGLTEGVAFADAEFLAGWIALRFLKQPETAVGHFQRLKSGVSFPISVARAHYWLGRAFEAANRPAEARAAYAAAARFPETFYGQLAMIALSPQARLSLPDERIDTKPVAGAFRYDDLVVAIRLLDGLDEAGTLRVFALHAADTVPDPATAALLVQLLRELNRPSIAIRVAKRAMQRQLPLVGHAYPVLAVPPYEGRREAPELALVLGLSRQESEFDPKAVSPAGAQGLMQLMPETAKQTARGHGLKYERSRLLGDPDYNMQVGMAHLSDLLRSYDGSYILTIAAYNAGGGRVREWIGIYGDPRSPGIDPIDWIEKIPFSETRNYVQRVLENTQVYRQRLARRDVPLQLWSDLRRAAGGRAAAPPGQLEDAGVGGPELELDVPTPLPAPRREQSGARHDEPDRVSAFREG